VIDPVALCQELVRFDTRNPPGDEAACSAFLETLLKEAGLKVTRHSFGAERFNLVARLDGEGPAAMFTGHIDTVPLGTVPWKRDPFGGVIIDGRLYGRGATDMKAGIASMIAAIAAEAEAPDRRAALTLVLTGGEETGSEGARALAQSGLIGDAEFLVVGEPTGNRFLNGHKGALWMRACCRGTTAHGSTPHLGDSAIYKAAQGILSLKDFGFNVAPHSAMGGPTVNVGTMQGGQNINSVPDLAEFTIDIRTTPALPHERAREQIESTLGADASLETLIDLPAVWSEPSEPTMKRLAAAYLRETGNQPLVEAASYFTDASILTPTLGNRPTVICGPGDPALAHKTDEFCLVSDITAATAIYRAFIRAAAH
jgi:succinyl-diaminopimelate desuccinylase